MDHTYQDSNFRRLIKFFKHEGDILRMPYYINDWSFEECNGIYQNIIKKPVPSNQSNKLPCFGNS